MFHHLLQSLDGVAIPTAKVLSSWSNPQAFKWQSAYRHMGKAWDAIRNGPVNSQFSTKLDGVDYKDGVHKLLSLHATRSSRLI